MPSLFRHEVISARSHHWLGSVRLAQSISLWLGTSIAVMLAISLIAYSILGSYTRKAHINGILATSGGDANITANKAGEVTEIRVKEGQRVHRGDILMIIDTDRTTSVVGGGSESVAALVAQQIRMRRLALDGERSEQKNQVLVNKQAIRGRLIQLQNELEKLDGEISLQRQRRELAKANLARYEKLAAANFISVAQLQTQQDGLLDQDVRLTSIERVRIGLLREKSGLASEERQADRELAVALAKLDTERAALNQEAVENESQRTTVITAPLTGTVSAITIGVGQWVATNQVLAAIQPHDRPLVAELYAPSRSAGFVTPGQKVLLRYAAYPYQKFGLQSGEVKEISASALVPSDLPSAIHALLGRRGNEGFFRVTVALDSQTISTYGKKRPLKTGMSLEADIIEDKRSIIEWMLEPVFAASKRL